MQSETKSRVDQLTSPAGHPVTVLRFEGRYCQHFKRGGAGHLPGASEGDDKLILLDFTKVDYINSSGIALVIQLLIEASNSGQKVYAVRAVAALRQGLHDGGHHQVRRLFPGQAEAMAAL